MMPDDNLLKKAAREDIIALARLDEAGFICGKEENAQNFTERLGKLRQNIANMEKQLQESGQFVIEDLKLEAKEKIDPKLFQESHSICQKNFRFAIDWVPGFFINPHLSFLFGGCAYFFYPDFFALFIIRRSFRQKRRWLIYRRDELLAHELCHVARLGLESHEYEETFAYQTATSSFRRLLGGVFRQQRDSFLFLGTSFLLLIGQLLRTFWLPALPAWPFWALFILFLAHLGRQHQQSCRRLAQALANIQPTFGDNSQAVLFRCTDQEIHDLAKLSSDSVLTWLDRQCQHLLRWRIIRHRFLPSQNTISGA